MNKNTVIGLVLIVAILIGWSLIFGPSKEEQAKMRRQQDSIVKVEKEKHIADSITLAARSVQKMNADTIKQMKIDSITTDSVVRADVKDAYGNFSNSVNGKKRKITIENKVAKFKFSSLGGKICYAELKDYHTFDTLPLLLINDDTSKFNFVFNTNYISRRVLKVPVPGSKNKTRDSVELINTDRAINTGALTFVPVITDPRFAGKDSISLKENDSLKFAMRLYPDSIINLKKDKYFELLYTIYGNNNMIKIQVNYSNLQDIIQSSNAAINLQWNMHLRQQEKSLQNEQMSSTIYYKYYGDEVDYLSETKNDNKDLATKVNWIGFKQQFFTTVLIADQGFTSAKIAHVKNDTIKKGIVKVCDADISIPLDLAAKQGFAMRMYFGPTHYKTLRKYQLDLERQIPLGWSSPYILGWINRFAVIPVFNMLESTGMNYGIIILILTILLKIVLFPIAYKTYKSSAKMRVLKPEIDEINAKIPKEKTMERQQATMSLYKKAGVNPLAGCIPMLLQMPILIALYRFFPASIELRQQSFLWATDLSTYDSVLNLGFNIPMYGDHVSLFTLLMTISTIIYTKVNNQLMGQQQQMPGMKWMMYLMPVMFLGFFNNFSAGLSYYYFLANMITFLQMWVIRKFIDEDAIHRQIQENRKKPDTKKKSGFQQRLEEMAKQRGYNPPKKK